MSFFKDTPLASTHNVKLSIASPELLDLVTALLRHWDIEPCLPDQEALEVQFSSGDTQLTLQPSDGPPENLPLPFKLEELWLTLQAHLFDPPRQHFRIPLRMRGTLCQGDMRDEFISVSLSDAGMRFEFFRELARDEDVTLEISLNGEPLVLEARVIYCVPTRNSGSMIIGVVYGLHQEPLKERMRAYLVETTLRLIRDQMDPQHYLSALGHLELCDASRLRLEGKQ